MAIYQILTRIFPQKQITDFNPKRIILIRPCCIGDVMLATPTLQGLRERFPQAHITWAVSGWSRKVIENHNLLDDILDTGSSDLPVKRIGEFWRFVRLLRAGNYDMAISLVRSPLMSLAVSLSGIPLRLGLDSAGRGFGYNIRLPINPDQPRHEADIYLDVIRSLKGDTINCRVNLPINDTDKQYVQEHLSTKGINAPYLVINPAGGNNPGMKMDSKRYPPKQFAQLADQLSEQLSLDVVLIGGPNDGDIVQAVKSAMKTPAITFIGELSFGEIGALAHSAQLYIGNDTGVTHLASAVCTKTVMILGPSDPKRYAPFTHTSLALWQATTVNQRGVSDNSMHTWSWENDGISVESALIQILEFMGD